MSRCSAEGSSSIISMQAPRFSSNAASALLTTCTAAGRSRGGRPRGERLLRVSCGDQGRGAAADSAHLCDVVGAAVLQLRLEQLQQLLAAGRLLAAAAAHHGQQVRDAVAAQLLQLRGHRLVVAAGMVGDRQQLLERLLRREGGARSGGASSGMAGWGGRQGWGGAPLPRPRRVAGGSCEAADRRARGPARRTLAPGLSTAWPSSSWQSSTLALSTMSRSSCFAAARSS